MLAAAWLPEACWAEALLGVACCLAVDDGALGVLVRRASKPAAGSFLAHAEVLVEGALEGPCALATAGQIGGDDETAGGPVEIRQLQAQHRRSSIVHIEAPVYGASI